MLPDIVMTTCQRRPQYVVGSLDSMLKSDPTAAQVGLRLVVDGDDDTFLGNHRRYAELLSDQDGERLRGRPVTHRIFFATSRALSGADRNKPLILLQDDVAFEPDWLSRAVGIARSIHRRGDSEFICALWGTHRSGRAMYGAYTVYPPQSFYGNVALFISAPLLGRLADHFGALAQRPTRPDDMEVQHFLLTKPYPPLYLAAPNLVHHRGAISTRSTASG